MIVQLDKELAKKTSIEAAILFNFLKDSYHIGTYKKSLIQDGFCRYSFIELEEINISGFKQRKALKKLFELNLIETKRLGMPAKLYFKIVN